MRSVATQGQLWSKAAHDWARLLKAAVLRAVAPYQTSAGGVCLQN